MSGYRHYCAISKDLATSDIHMVSLHLHTFSDFTFFLSLLDENQHYCAGFLSEWVTLQTFLVFLPTSLQIERYFVLEDHQCLTILR